MSFPFYRQHDAMQCGIACLQMVCARYGRKYTSEELSALCHATSEGVSLLGITRAAESLGLHTVCGRFTIGSLREAVLPCILHWNQNHFVVLYRIGRHRRGEVYYIADPGKGLITYGAEDFKACWVSTRSDDEDKGIAMLLTPTPAFGTRSGGEVGETAHIDEYVRSLPLGYNTMIGRDGVGLSAGQRQRILIARAVYKNPEFIFLDEATNSLDANNERAIVEDLSRFYRGKTVLVIAHRLSTVRNADRIVVMEKGRVVETGTHDELAALKGAYYRLVKNQLEL